MSPIAASPTDPPEEAVIDVRGRLIRGPWAAPRRRPEGDQLHAKLPGGLAKCWRYLRWVERQAERACDEGDVVTEIVAWAPPEAKRRAVLRHSVAGLCDYVYAQCFEVRAVRLRFSFSDGMTATVRLSASRAEGGWLTVQGPDKTRARREEFFNACLTRAREENERMGLPRKERRAAFRNGVLTSLVGSAIFALLIFLLQHT